MEPLQGRQGTVEQSTCGEVEVHPRLQLAEPVLLDGQDQGQGRQQELVEEVRNGPRMSCDEHAEHAEHETDEHAEDVGELDREQVGGRQVPYRVHSSSGVRSTRSSMSSTRVFGRPMYCWAMVRVSWPVRP